jgi:acetyl-CoA acetyltransferase family protein
MALEKVFIPYGAYFSSPFCRWQGSLAGEHAVKLAAETVKSFLVRRRIAAEAFDAVALGMTVPQRHGFWGAPWLAALIGAPGATGPTFAQACATSARLVASGALEIEHGVHRALLLVACDRTSNGPHVYYPAPGGIGGTGEAENPVLDNFSFDPHARVAMIDTAEAVAKRAGIAREEQDAMALLRFQQYEQALADDRAFQRRYLQPIELGAGKKGGRIVAEDEGIHPTTADGLARLRPVKPDGTVTYGSQTHPADGNAAMVLCAAERARELSADPAVTVRVLGFGSARVEPTFMPMAPVPAARTALANAGVTLAACKAIKTHNPFAVNDVYLCRELALGPEAVNRFGSPLVYGHPQGPTGLRALAELVEELVQSGGGVGLFTGCAAGDTAMAVVVRVDG